MKQEIYELFETDPVIAAVKDMRGLRSCMELEDIHIVFVLFGDICSLGDMVAMLKAAGKTVMVHMDLITGLDGQEAAVDFIKQKTGADGIISTKPVLIRKARRLGLHTTLRVFVIDSMALNNLAKQVESSRPDVIEILPGVMPKIIKRICGMVSVPVIAGGLISEKEDVVAALSAGAISVSTTREDIWRM